VCPDRERCHVTGALDGAIVRRYVRRRIDALGYCYEKPLLADPHLAGGSLTVDFTIRADGTVGDVAASGISVAVAGCAADVIAKLQLPAGGVTQVAYVLVYAPPAR